MLLEEALLHLLRNSGFETVENATGDETLRMGRAGISVLGRGGSHQIDAIADYIYSPPFCNPIRLLVEAKFQSKKVKLPTIRNSVGILKDLQEFFVPSRGNSSITKKRYHYTSSVLSATEYSIDAQKYAYAHDIYLIPFARSRFFQPIINAISDLQATDFGVPNSKRNIGLVLKDLREGIRNSLRGEFNLSIPGFTNAELMTKLETYVVACKRIDVAYLAVAGKSIPIVLVKNPDFAGDFIGQLRAGGRYKLYWDLQNWRDLGWTFEINDNQLFSFDLPEEILRLSLIDGQLNERAAISLKKEFLGTMRIFHKSQNEQGILSLRIDDEWLNSAVEQLSIRESWDRVMNREESETDNNQN